MNLVIGVATMSSETPPGEIASWLEHADGLTGSHVHVVRNTVEHNLGIVRSYHEIYENTNADIICYAHDDVMMREDGWNRRVINEFKTPSVAIVGFGGALAHGSPDLYKTPYRLQNLQRYGYASNVDDAEVHGERFAGSRDAAVLDGFTLCVRRSFLDRIGGWSFVVGHLDFIGYDYAICALARRYGYTIRLAGIRCHHFGGRTSTNMSPEGKQQDYDRSHRWFYDEFRDVMPVRAKP